VLDLAGFLRAAGGLDRVAGAGAVDEDAFLAVRRARLAKPASTLSSDVTFTSQNTPPISAATASPFSFCRSKMATFTPLAASARAVAAPRPDAPPVTTAATVLSSFMVLNPLPENDYSASTMVTLATPPPSHIVCRPYFLPRARSAWISVDISLVPDAPSGWPSAIAPPLTLSFSGPRRYA
jgi:hypothetical protein